MFADLNVSSAHKTASFVIRILPHKKRFSFWRAFCVVFGIYTLYYILASILYITIPELFIQRDYSEIRLVLGLLGTATFFTLFYYFTVNHYYSLIAEKKGGIQYLFISLLSAIVFITYVIIDDYMIQPEQSAGKRATAGVMFYYYTTSVLFVIGLSLLIAYLTYLRDEKKQHKALEEENLQLEIEKSHANFNFLKSQINPHFLHNTLNFLYAKSLPYSPELSEGILTLSDIMRYALSEANTKNGKAALKDEIEHVRNVIRIHQLRYNNNLQVNFEVKGVVNNVTIIPFVLITIVENAFKHGDLKSTEQPIDIKLTIEHNSLHFYCRNKKKTGPKELSTSIGLDNVKKRLDLAYKDQYNLNIKDERDLYTTQLTILSL